MDARSARSSLDLLQAITGRVTRERAALGASQSRPESALRAVEGLRDNSLSAQAQLLNADIAAEAAEVVRGRIRESIGAQLLGTANIDPQVVLRLLQ